MVSFSASREAEKLTHEAPTVGDNGAKHICSYGDGYDYGYDYGYGYGYAYVYAYGCAYGSSDLEILPSCFFCVWIFGSRDPSVLFFVLGSLDLEILRAVFLSLDLRTSRSFLIVKIQYFGISGYSPRCKDLWISRSFGPVFRAWILGSRDPSVLFSALGS